MTGEIREYKTITNRTKKFLNKQESYDLDFKRLPSAVEPDDIVAFANSNNGGTILVGVDEVNNDKGQQRGKIVGCQISDENKLSIINKAVSCRPPVDIEIFIENTKAKPIFRIEIPSGKYKPYCTNKGEYLIRHDGRNIPITQDRLLDIFLERQGSVFIERFKNATRELETELNSTKQNLSEINREINIIKNNFEDEIKNIISNIEKLENKVENQLEEMSFITDGASEYSKQAMHFSDEDLEDLRQEIDSVNHSVNDINSKINALLKHFNIKDFSK